MTGPPPPEESGPLTRQHIRQTRDLANAGIHDQDVELLVVAARALVEIVDVLVDGIDQANERRGFRLGRRRRA